MCRNGSTAFQVLAGAQKLVTRVPFQQRGQLLRRRRAHRGRHDRRLGVPRHEQAAPGVLGPAGRGDVEVPVAGQQAVPVHAGQVADRVALVGVRDQLRRRGGAGGEVAERHRVGRRRACGHERPVRVLRAGEGVPARPGRRPPRSRRPPRPWAPLASAASASSSRHTTCRAPLRLTRSDSSRAVSPTWQGITAAPSLRQASKVSHSSGRASSTIRTRWPGRTPWSRSQQATVSDRADSSWKVIRTGGFPLPGNNSSAVAALSAAMTSNHSRAQLNDSDRGQRNSAAARSGSVRSSSRRSRASRNRWCASVLRYRQYPSPFMPTPPFAGLRAVPAPSVGSAGRRRPRRRPP